MKTVFLLLLFIPSYMYPQKYLLLDSLKSNFSVNEYTLDTKDIYNFKKDINLYNVFVSKNNILLITVLPDLDERILPRMDERGNNWHIINIDDIKDKIISKDKLMRLVVEWYMNNTPDKKTLEYQLVKKENGSYYISKTCLTELFSIVNLKFPLVSSYGAINIGEKKVTIKEMERSFVMQFPKQDFIMDVTTDNMQRTIQRFDSYSFRNYLSKEYTIKGNKAYQFWTFDGWWEIDGYNEYRGIDRFLYIPNKGIVGGSYDFYFRAARPRASSNNFAVSDYELWGNIINEKIMIAKELK